MQRICLLALIGLPAIGKTKLSKFILQKSISESHSVNFVHFCFDNFMPLSHGDVVESSASSFDYKNQRAGILKNLDKLICSLKTSKSVALDFMCQIGINTSISSSDDFIIICDDNNYYHSMRYKLYQLAKKYSLSYAQIYFKVDNMETVLQRNANRPVPEQIPENIMKQMSIRLEPPNVEQNHWEKQTLILQENFDLQIEMEYLKIFNFIASSLVLNDKSRLEDVPTKQVVSPPTLIHQLDLKLRRRIKELLNLEVNSDVKRTKGFDLNEKRKQILNDFRKNVNCDSTDLHNYVTLL